MKLNDLSFVIGGEAGSGINRSGFLFAKACTRGGLRVIGVNDYQSLIKGGHNFYTVRISDREIYSHLDQIDLLIALNAETIGLHKTELGSGGGIIYDRDDLALDFGFLGREDLKAYPVPLRKIVLDDLKEPHNIITRNTVALGVACAITDYELALLEGILMETFKPDVAKLNTRAAQIGYAYAKKNFEDDFGCRLAKTGTASKRQIFLSGNEAVGLGALKAGCKFYAGYPMTPTTGLLHFMASNERDFGLAVIQPEGEIAAINMISGAAYAGARAMTATSGGGFCLMSEGLGMAGMTETPVVIVVGQRPGPSTGLPTHTAQGDLRFVVHASQGEFPRIVIAPGDIEECYYETMQAFNWAEKYQLPVIILADKYLLESEISVEPFDTNRVGIERGLLVKEASEIKEEYSRYEVTETGVSPRAFPSMKQTTIHANSDEHDENGITTEDPIVTVMMSDKRMRKLETLSKEFSERKIETIKLYGPEEAPTTIVSWGSTKGPIRETLRLLESEHTSANFLQVLYVHPFPKDDVGRILKKSKKVIVVENNKTSQLSSLLKEHSLRKPDNRILKYDGRPFHAEFLSRKIKEAL